MYKREFMREIWHETAENFSKTVGEEREDHIEKEKNGRGGKTSSQKVHLSTLHPAKDYRSHPFIAEITC